MNARIRELAEQAGLDPCVFYDNLLRISDFAELVRQDEREACAKLCEELRNENYSGETEDWCEATIDCAKAIRGRTE
jgi:hypothetical protein